MATITKTHLRPRQFGNTPYGNLAALHYSLATLANGAASPSDLATAIQIADVVDLGELPDGMSLIDMKAVISTAFTALLTASLGFKYSDGVDHAVVPQDAAYFGAGLVLNATGTLRAATAKQPIKLPKPARLILTIAGAANAKIARVDFFIFGEIGSP